MNTSLPRDWTVLGKRLDAWSPPSGAFNPNAAWTAYYQRHELIPDRDGTPIGAQAGFLRLTCVPEPRGARMRITEEARAGATTVTTQADFECAADALYTPRQWNMEIGWKSLVPLVKVDDLGQKRSGRVEAGRIVFSGERERRQAAPAAWTVSWLLFAAAQRLPFQEGAALEFDLFEEADMHKPGQRMAYVGMHPVALASGVLALHVFEQTGHGVLPWRWWVDAQHRVVLAASERRGYLLADEAKGVSK